MLTFLRLRQPAWASDDVLTLVSHSGSTCGGHSDEDLVTAEVLAAHRYMQAKLLEWSLSRRTP